ncbi:TetR/AcrR family transcriptional regulator [Kribbella sp. DT2]|uniref:TetR/AcrR family transcriptional regulator n=1 Tax=Kribbella sp. DT2 TaxID=3393427 RepID=UPI003CE81C44
MVKEGGRPRSFTEAGRRRQFVGCAIEVLADSGFAATTIQAVADRAEITKSVVLYHFRSKAELLEAVVEQVYGEAGPVVAAALDEASGPRERLRVYVAACVRYAWTHRTELRAVSEVFANLRRPDGTPRYGVAENAPMLDFVESLLRDGQEAGEFRAFAARPMAITVRAAVDALPAAFDADPELDGEIYADELATLFDRAATA